MKKPKPKISRPIKTNHERAVSSREALVTAEQASVALNLPLYFFIDKRKREELGIPFYLINRMVRYRIKELHKWQVGLAAQKVAQLNASGTGGVND